jgi:hypothetical protein
MCTNGGCDEGEGGQPGAGAMLFASRLAGISALEAHYAGIDASTQTIHPLLRPDLGGRAQDASDALKAHTIPA